MGVSEDDGVAVVVGDCDGVAPVEREAVGVADGVSDGESDAVWVGERDGVPVDVSVLLTVAVWVLVAVDETVDDAVCVCEVDAVSDAV